MNPKINTLKDLEYFGAFQYCTEMVLQWEKLKPDNLEIREFATSLATVFFYVNQIQSDRMHYDSAMSEMRSEKNAVIMRHLLANAKITELEAELKKMKSIINL